MAKNTHKTQAPTAKRRTGRGFTRAVTLMQARIKAVGKSRGFTVSRLLTHWTEIVGEDIAACALPVKVGYGRQGVGATLTLLTTGANAPLLQMQAEKIRAKVNECYGYTAIEKVRITQSAPTGFAEGQVAFAPRPAKPMRREASEEIKTAARETAAAVKNNDLRKALAALGENVLTRKRTPKR